MLLDAPVMFFGGKGGVGKTTVSAATAVRLAARGRRVLLVSTDPAHNLGHIWGQSLLDAPLTLEPRLDAIELDPAAITAQHLRAVGDSMRAMMPERLHKEVDKHLEMSRHSPGMHEAALLERIADLVAGSDYDHLIFDTAPSGHTSRLMALPELMAAYTDGLLARRDKSDKFSELVRGMGGDSGGSPVDRRNQQIRSTLLKRRKKFEHLRSVLTDPAQCVFHIVLTAERLPVLESMEFYEELSSHGVHVGGAVVNRRTPDEAGEFLAARRRVEDDALALLDLPVPVHELPWLPGEIGTRAALEQIAALL
ncbi:ArsA family ATPase [Corynebacterium sp. p3-SID1056]|uniref:ArsA family ATPase n=1 Tax=Corynebacterium sp. p3-SID1056 TaxID=2916092 RepID=UPI0021A4CF03|nr:ArsA family ATPase [Corynebacterium sp. p3-SID1056]MCT2339148.1 ArsA family ATPase [Corynebacterium sp. p3-SID1056]